MAFTLPDIFDWLALCGAQDPNPNPNPTPTPEAKFTQEDVNRIVRERLARFKAGEDDPAATTQAEKEELTRLRQERQDRLAREAEEQKNYEKAKEEMRKAHQEELSRREQREKELAAELKADRVRGQIIAAAAKYRAIKPDQLADLLERVVDLDEKHRPFVKDEVSGSKKFNGRGELMTPDEYVKLYLDENPHLVQPVPGGQGSGAGRGKHTSDEGAEDGTAEYKAAKAEYDRLKLEALKAPGDYALVTKVQQAERKMKSLKPKKA